MVTCVLARDRGQKVLPPFTGRKHRPVLGEVAAAPPSSRLDGLTFPLWTRGFQFH